MRWGDGGARMPVCEGYRNRLGAIQVFGFGAVCGAVGAERYGTFDIGPPSQNPNGAPKRPSLFLAHRVGPMSSTTASSSAPFLLREAPMHLDLMQNETAMLSHVALTYAKS